MQAEGKHKALDQSSQARTDPEATKQYSAPNSLKLQQIF
jgi:hypothetical protein